MARIAPRILSRRRISTDQHQKSRRSTTTAAENIKERVAGEGSTRVTVHTSSPMYINGSSNADRTAAIYQIHNDIPPSHILRTSLTPRNSSAWLSASYYSQITRHWRILERPARLPYQPYRSLRCSAPIDRARRGGSSRP